MNNITIFTIKNNTADMVGPYGLNSFMVPANSTLDIQLPLNGLLSDSMFFSDLNQGNISLLIANQPIDVSLLFNNYFHLLSSSEFSNNSKNIAGNATTLVKTGTGILHAIIIGNNNTGGTVTVYDNMIASGTPLMTLQLGSPAGGLLSTTGLSGPEYLNTLNIKFSTGLTIVTTGSSNNNITIIYQ